MVGTVWRQFAAHHLVLAIAIGLAYWVMVAVTGFARGVVGDLADLWRKRLVERLDRSIQQRVSPFEKKYREHVLASVQFIDHKGLATVGPFTPELDAVFVDVSLVPRPPHEITPGVLGDSVPPGARQALGELIGRPRPVVLAIVGGPGSGKTTLLRHTARQACSGSSSRSVRGLPVLLYLRDHAAAITADPAAARLPSLVRSTLGDLPNAEPPGWLEQKLHSGQCTVLLDGLDEVARQDDRAKVAAWAERQIRSYPGNDFLITSRPDGYRTAPVEGAEVVQVCGFTGSQVGQFVRGWYQAVERHGAGAEGPDSDTRAAKGAADLLRRLDQATGLHDLTANPLLMTMIANVHRYRDGLPGGRAELYAEICQVMLWRRKEAKNLASAKSGEKNEAVLRELAYRMMEQRVSDLSRKDIISELKLVLHRLSSKATPEALLADVGSSGLLVERETEQYSFAHQTFQEYLAAAHIRDKGLTGVLADNVNDPWWRETTLLYAARVGAGAGTDAIVQACLNAGTVTALALAFDCVDTGSEINEELRGRLDAILASGLAPETEPERRRLIVGIMLTRHLRERSRAADGTRVCVRPISEDIYRLFQADTLTPPPDGPAGEASTDAAVGMRGSDAAAFLLWANSSTVGEAIYRLPGSAALNDPSVQLSVSAIASGIQHASIWSTDGASSGGSPGLWTLPGTPHPREVDAATLAASIENDLAQSAATQFRLLLLRSFVGAIDLGRCLNIFPALDRAKQEPNNWSIRSCYLDLGGYLDRAHLRYPDLARALARDSEHYRARNSGLNRAHGHNRAVARAISHDLNLARDLARVFDLDVAAVPIPDAVDLDHVGDARAGIIRVLNNFDRAPALDHALALDRTRALAGRNDASYYSDAAVMGRSLSQALAMAIDERGAADTWTPTFSRALVTQAGLDDDGYSPDPDVMPGLLLQAVEALRQINRGWHDREWSLTVAERLEKTASPVFNRQQRPTPEIATSIRLAALCLAGEADWRGRSALGDMFRELAAGITLLELRYGGQLPATEIVVLAMD